METQTAVDSLVNFIATNSNWDDDAAVDYLVANGFSKTIAENTVRFTGVAFARLFLRELGVELSNQYILFRGDGSKVESGELDKNQFFLAAAQSAAQLCQHPGFKPLAHSSPEFEAVNQALHAGSDAKDLVLGPVAIFIEPATRAGFERAQEAVTKLARAAANLPTEETGQRSNTLWWKFW